MTGLKYDMFMQEAADPDKALQTLTDKTGFSTLLTLYSTSIFRLTDRWEMVLGVNTQWFTLNDHYTIEPRVSLKYDFSSEHSLSLAYGMHSRLEMLNYYFTQKEGDLINRNLDFTKAHHLSIGYEWDIDINRHLKIEPYIQYLYDVPVIPGTNTAFINLQGNDDWFISERLVNTGEGINYGMDITFERYMSQGFYYLVTASVFDARYRTSDGVWYNTRYNRNYVLNLLAGKEWMLGRNRQNLFGINGRVTFQGGGPIHSD